MHEECVSLQQSLSVVGVLECVVRRCVGPEGGSVLLTRDTGEIIITRHGQRILSTLHLEHPMARMVLDCVSAHAQVTADGTKSFILLLAALLRGIRNSADKHGIGHSSAPYLRNLAHRLLAFSCKEFDDVITHKILPNASFYCSCHSYKSSSILDLLVGGYIAGRLGVGQADILKRVLCEFYHKVSQGQDAVRTITFLHSHFSLLHTTVTGLPIGCSEVIEGLVVTRDWSVWTDPNGSAKALIIYESLGSCLIAASNNISLCVQHDWLSRTDRALEQKLASVLQLQVCVLLSSVKQPESVLQWARLNHISLLECVDSAQLDLLCRISGTETVPHPSLQHLLMLKFCSRFQLGGHRYACLGTFSQGVPQAHTLVLCGPAPGLLDQIVCVSRGVFTLLEHLCQSIISTQKQLNKYTDSEIETQENLESSVPVSSQSQRSDLDLSQIFLSSQDLWDRIMRAGGVIPVGGTFEFLLHHFLLNARNHGDSESCRLLAEALLCVPRTLYSRRRFLDAQTHLLSELKQRTNVQDLSKWSELKFRLNEGSTLPVCLESVSSKQQLVVSVLQCLNRLLCIGAILHTRSPLLTHPSTSSEDEEGESENLHLSDD
ncbi:Bardet-Biedl syndrome 10 protein isoform X1 [Triplophysa rosa]|uniref:Bardet-Biedl syndrome 10 protein n=1 Tax=Triplophysa rosa TaxID=992332 RepID=A0A9W7WLR9_TRIRA|nr:Bardet-Biedl syndrome 10 protein isoform X1 [Triplophysa rosa]KAI7802353.1 putative Bardet-Biedl syndrome 10 protein [Triplophysa rosa]